MRTALIALATLLGVVSFAAAAAPSTAGSSGASVSSGSVSAGTGGAAHSGGGGAAHFGGGGGGGGGGVHGGRYMGGGHFYGGGGYGAGDYGHRGYTGRASQGGDHSAYIAHRGYGIVGYDSAALDPREVAPRGGQGARNIFVLGPRIRSAATAKPVIDARRPPQLPRKRPHFGHRGAEYSNESLAVENLGVCALGNGMACSNELILPCPFPINPRLTQQGGILLDDCWRPIKEDVLQERKVLPGN